MAEKKERVVFLSGKLVDLRPHDLTDLERNTLWINDREVTEFMGRIFPASCMEEEEWLKRKRENEVILAIDTKEGLHIGNIDFHKIDHLNGTAEIGIMIGDKNYWSKGYGFDAEMIMLDYGFNSLNLRKILHLAELRNQKSVGLAKKCGGVKEGLLRRQIFKAGRYWDIVIFAIFKRRWQGIWQKYRQEK